MLFAENFLPTQNSYTLIETPGRDTTVESARVSPNLTQPQMFDASELFSKGRFKVSRIYFFFLLFFGHMDAQFVATNNSFRFSKLLPTIESCFMFRIAVVQIFRLKIQ